MNKNSQTPLISTQSPSKTPLQITKSMLTHLFPKQFLNGLNKQLRMQSPKSQEYKYKQILDLNKQYKVFYNIIKKELSKLTAIVVKQREDKEIYKKRLSAFQGRMMKNKAVSENKTIDVDQNTKKCRCSSNIDISHTPLKTDSPQKQSSLLEKIMELQQSLNLKEYMLKEQIQSNQKYILQIQNLKGLNQSLSKENESLIQKMNQFLQQSNKNEKEDLVAKSIQYKMLINNVADVYSRPPQLTKNTSNISIYLPQSKQQMSMRLLQLQASRTQKIVIPSQMKLKALSNKPDLNSSVMSIRTQDIDDMLMEELQQYNSSIEQPVASLQLEKPLTYTPNINSSMVIIDLNSKIQI